MQELVKSGMPYQNELSKEINISLLCVNHILFLIENLSKLSQMPRNSIRTMCAFYLIL